MLERIGNLPASIEGVKASGVVTRDDYERVLEPLFEAAKKEGRRLRFVYQLDPSFEAFTPGAAWDDGRFGLRYMKHFDACAIVSDLGWIKGSIDLTRFLIPCPVQVFKNSAYAESLAWLGSVATTPKASHRLLAEQGVIVLDVNAALSAQDFEALAEALDSWVVERGELNGLVIHARKFPGWENIAALFGHLRFVRDHHDKIRRVALATDEPAAGFAPAVAELFIKARVYAFKYEALDEAIAWASAGSAPSAS